MEAALIHMESLFKPEGGSGPADLAFHLSIYDAAHNPLFRQLLEQFRDLFERFWTRPYGRPDFASNSFPYHRTLLKRSVIKILTEPNRRPESSSIR